MKPPLSFTAHHFTCLSARCQVMVVLLPLFGCAENGLDTLSGIEAT